MPIRFSIIKKKLNTAPVLTLPNKRGKYVLMRVRNNCQPPPLSVPIELSNVQAPLIVYIDTTDVAHTMAMVMTEKERYKNSRDIIKHAKKCEAYDFHGTLDPGQADI